MIIIVTLVQSPVSFRWQGQQFVIFFLHPYDLYMTVELLEH